MDGARTGSAPSDPQGAVIGKETRRSVRRARGGNQAGDGEGPGRTATARSAATSYEACAVASCVLLPRMTDPCFQ